MRILRFSGLISGRRSVTGMKEKPNPESVEEKRITATEAEIFEKMPAGSQLDVTQ